MYVLSRRECKYCFYFATFSFMKQQNYCQNKHQIEYKKYFVCFFVFKVRAQNHYPINDKKLFFILVNKQFYILHLLFQINGCYLPSKVDLKIHRKMTIRKGL